ncbi:prepilin-type N-terminal cleavage/methylation domain-containing protein [Desulfobacula sp.]|uniref:prepilin-type N-terminal cleavage/methylation domain-containing protein n=1 Tax=Desulfobacula sp. TaxID=2593537 RepID=UPI0025BE199B|nr:prepilin-type N-terminal cleavage/methylation domain-containing protein [Desulfobacula sp.]
MLQKLRGNNSKGFTLIELMIVIAIIGILAAIAIPNFIAYRNKSFCSAAESDANAIAAGIADYFSVPSIVAVPTQAGTNAVDFTTAGVAKTVTLSFAGTANANTGSIISATGDPADGITITVTDTSGRCPDDYTTPSADWGGGVGAAGSDFTKLMSP